MSNLEMQGMRAVSCVLCVCESLRDAVYSAVMYCCCTVFLTGSDRIPVAGLESLQVCVRTCVRVCVLYTLYVCVHDCLWYTHVHVIYL